MGFQCLSCNLTHGQLSKAASRIECEYCVTPVCINTGSR